MATYRECEDTFDLNRFMVVLRAECPFYASISRHMRKVPTKDLPTAGVVWDADREELVLYYNPDFLASLNSNRQVRGIMEHEYLHFIFLHIVNRRKSPHWLWNIATDLAINSVIFDSAKNESGSGVPLPDCVLLPGRRPTTSPVTDDSVKSDHRDAIDKANNELADAIARLPLLLSSEEYYYALLQKMQDIIKQLQDAGVPIENSSEGIPMPSPGPGNGIGSLDEHAGWDNIDEDNRERIEGYAKSVLEQAVKDADSSSNGWGNIPSEIRDEIRRSVSRIVPWKRLLKKFVGHLIPAGRTASIKRINKRYPYIHPGTKRNRVAKLLVAVDQSGSVDNNMLAQLFGALAGLTRLVEIDWVPFDAACRESDIKRWRKGAPPPTVREKCGGTCFDAPTEIVNDPKNRGRWDGFLIATDGECSAPVASRVKRGWVVAKGQKLLFDTSELLISLDNGDVKEGTTR